MYNKKCIMIEFKLGNKNKCIFSSSSIFCLSPSLAFDLELLLISPPHYQFLKTFKFVSLQTFTEYFLNDIYNIHPNDMDVCTSTHFDPK